MTALANLPEKWRKEAVDHDRHKDPLPASILRECADELTATLSPAELGGVEGVVAKLTVYTVYADTKVISARIHDVEAMLPPGTYDLYTTPRAAEAVSEAELAEVIQRHTGCADSDSIYAAVAVLQALTPPSAKGA